MENIFLKLLNMSITASWLVMAVAVLRLLLKKAPKWINTVLWAFVGLRLVCPFSFESVLSLIPSTETIPKNVMQGPSFDVNTGINFVDNTVNDYLGSHYFEGVTVPTDTGMTTISILSVIWFIGIVAMILYAVISFLRLHKKVREGVVLKDNIWLCDRIDTPFILGLFRPRIFLPSSMNEADMEYVIAHEKAHLKRNDHWWKPLGFLLLTVYWFNPVMWLAYILLCRDIELACDEKVIKAMGAEIKKPYSEALINCSVPRKSIAACPLAFGETGVKGRIKSVLSYKKPTLWIIIIAVISCIVVGVCFLTNPKTDLKKTNPELDKAVSQAIFEINAVTLDILEFKSAEYPEFECTAEGHIIYGYEEEGDNVTVYLREQFAGFIFQNGYFVAETVHRLPAVFVFVKTDNGYTLSDYNFAEIGLAYDNSIKSLFPSEYHSRVMNVRDKDYADLWAQCVAYAKDYLKKIGREAEIRDYSEVPHTMLTDVGVSVEVSHNLTENSSFNKYNSDIGYYETLEDGVRYVYRTAYEKDKNLIVFTTELYGEGENATNQIIEKIEINGQTGDIVSQNSYPYEIPETTPEKGKSYSSDFLNYTKATDIVRDEANITAMHYPVTKNDEAAILVGEAYGSVVADYLDNVKWKKSTAPLNSLSSPGSVEFVVDENYRITVYKRKSGSLFAYAVVKVNDEERYYHASYDDYEKAVAILHTPESITSPVTWTYSPWLSATFHSFFCIDFDFDYTHIITTCKNGQMQNLDAEGQPKASSLRFEKGEHVCWTPDEAANEVQDTAEVNFTVYNGEEQLYYGSILFDCIEKKQGSATYYVYLQNSNGLILLQKNKGACLIEAENTESVSGIDEPDNYSDLPELVVIHENEGIFAWRGTATWSFTINNGTAQTINADAHHASDRLDEISKHYAINVADSDENVKLNFEIIPDSIKVNAWFVAGNGNIKAFDAETDGLNIIHKNKNETCLYEVVAEWNSSDKYSGKIHYAFCVISEQSDISALKEKYPQFFGLSTDGGLTVYIWQMAENNYNCYLMNSDMTFAITEIKGASISEMRAILSTYDIDRNDITIQPCGNPLSSYLYIIDDADAYRKKIEEKFWS